MSSWIKRKLSQVKNSGSNTPTSPTKSQNPDVIRFEVFRSHWTQIAEIICLKDVDLTLIVANETLLRQPKPVTQDDVDAVRNLLEQMVYLLADEQSTGQQLGPILEYMVMDGIMIKLFNWYLRSGEYMKQVAINLIKVYEVIISQGEHSLLHHKQIVTPMLKLLSSCSDINSEEVDGHVVLLLNLLCVWISRDPTLLNVFFWSSDEEGSKNFIIFSHLVAFIHREGSIGQQSRDALLLCVSMSSEDTRVANYIVSTDFCPVLATGLSALYSSLPRHIDVRTEEWHFLRKEDWSRVPALVNFMNSFEFCNSVVEAAESIVGETLLDYIYHGFLVSVFGPALHKPSASEVVVTTAYLNLFLQSVTAPSLLRCFLRFLLCHRHDNSLIINTLIQRIGSSSKLASVSLSLFHTLLDLNCEDLMLHLVFRYLIPCQHILSSQHRSICDVDMYCASAHRFVTLSPKCYGAQLDDCDSIKGDVTVDSGVEDSKENSVADVKSPVTKERSASKTSSGSNNSSDQSAVITSPTTMAEFGPDHESQMSLRTSYMDYLENANAAVLSCKEACETWSEPYNGVSPPTDAVTEISSIAGVSSSGLTRTAISLRSINESSVIHKKHAVSDPTPMQSRKMTDSTNNPALHALNATYQALNATANILNNGPTVFIPSRENSPRKDASDSGSVEKDAPVCSNGDDESEIVMEMTSETKSQSDEDAATCEDVESNCDAINCEDIEQNPDAGNCENAEKNPGDVNRVDAVSNPASISCGDAKATEEKGPASPLQASSVDEFFRKLMDSVPVNARQNVEAQIASIDSTDHGEALASPTEEESRGFDDNVSKDSESSNVSVADSVGDDYIDDSVSVNSSFYETDLEYAPVEFSTPSLAAPLKMNATPYTGPFLSTLFGKIDQMPNNSLYENLLLTGIVSRLSCYPQPLLRSFLLNTHVVFHPAVRSLYQVLSGVRDRIDAYSQTVDDFSGLLCKAEKYLLVRDSGEENKGTNLIKDMPMPVPRVKTRNTVLGEVFMRRRKQKQTQRVGKLESLVEKQNPQKSGIEGQSMFYANFDAKFSNRIGKQISDSQTKNVVFACVVLHEFLKELAAVSQEHAVTCGWL